MGRASSSDPSTAEEAGEQPRRSQLRRNLLAEEGQIAYSLDAGESGSLGRRLQLWQHLLAAARGVDKKKVHPLGKKAGKKVPPFVRDHA